MVISIHAPRVGSDFLSCPCRLLYVYFNPRSPCRERPNEDMRAKVAELISIHAPRVGSDSKFYRNIWFCVFFCVEYTFLFPYITILAINNRFLWLLCGIMECESPMVFMCASCSHLHNQGAFRLIGGFCANMFHFTFVVIS